MAEPTTRPADCGVCTGVRTVSGWVRATQKACPVHGGDRLPGAVLWRYLPGGRVKHALPPARLGTFRETALCGIAPAWYQPESHRWRGAAAGEDETAAQLPECRRCARLVVDHG